MSTEKYAELVEGLCSVMHDAYEAAAAKAGWETQERSRKPWEDVPEANKVTMRAAVSAALDALTSMGWVSPEEATAREAAARREALLEAAEEVEEDAADAWGGNAPWMTSGVRVANLAAEWLRESAAALADPERDKEGGND